MEQIQINKISSLTPTKTNIDLVGAEMAELVLQGMTDPIEFSIRCKFAIECLTNAMERVKDTAIKEVGTGTELIGAKVEVAESGVKYDYSVNEDWKANAKRLEPLLAQKKVIEENIKMATKIGKSIIDEDTGEIIASPVKKTSTTTLKITLGK